MSVRLAEMSVPKNHLVDIPSMSPFLRLLRYLSLSPKWQIEDENEEEDESLRPMISFYTFAGSTVGGGGLKRFRKRKNQ